MVLDRNLTFILADKPTGLQGKIEKKQSAGRGGFGGRGGRGGARGGFGGDRGGRGEGRGVETAVDEDSWRVAGTQCFQSPATYTKIRPPLAGARKEAR